MTERNFKEHDGAAALRDTGSGFLANDRVCWDGGVIDFDDVKVEPVSSELTLSLLAGQFNKCRHFELAFGFTDSDCDGAALFDDGPGGWILSKHSTFWRIAVCRCSDDRHEVQLFDQCLGLGLFEIDKAFDGDLGLDGHRTLGLCLHGVAADHGP